MISLNFISFVTFNIKIVWKLESLIYSVFKILWFCAAWELINITIQQLIELCQIEKLIYVWDRLENVENERFTDMFTYKFVCSVWINSGTQFFRLFGIIYHSRRDQLLTRTGVRKKIMLLAYCSVIWTFWTELDVREEKLYFGKTKFCSKIFINCIDTFLHCFSFCHIVKLMGDNLDFVADTLLLYESIPLEQSNKVK